MAFQKVRIIMFNDEIVFIGGIGGSGTRVVAEIVKGLGVHMGRNLNGALDNLDWPSEKCGALVRNRLNTFDENLPEMSRELIKFGQKMTLQSQEAHSIKYSWGTKVPGIFYYLSYLKSVFPNMRYIHTIRHGLDMAYSQNHNQLFNWGGFFDIPPLDGATPRNLLKYWVCANNYALQNCRAWLPNQHLIINFEELCSDSHGHVHKIANFLNCESVDAVTDSIVNKITKQESQGRYQLKGQAQLFDDSDIAALGALGFKVEWKKSTS